MRYRFVLALAVLWAGPAAGQTLFEWPDTAVDVSKYTTIEECWAAVGRVRRRIAEEKEWTDANRGMWRDTMPDLVQGTAVEPLPERVRETARACLSRFADPEAVPIDAYWILVPLYLHAGWDDRAWALVERRMAAVSDDDPEALAAAADTMIDILRGSPKGGHHALAVEPPRYDLVDELLARYADRISDRVLRFRTYSRSLSWARYPPGDSVEAKRERDRATRVLALFDSLADHEIDRLVQQSQSMLTEIEAYRAQFGALMELSYGGREALLDSLRSSTSAYVKLTKQFEKRLPPVLGQLYAEATGGFAIGSRAPAIEADIWIGCEQDPCEPRPRPGRVSLVVFASPGECVGVIAGPGEMYLDRCAVMLIRLRRLKQRFPELDITTVSRSLGFWGYLKEGITPEREAELTWRWLNSFGVEAALAMVRTDYWRLPDPDARRIDTESANDRNYTFGKGGRVQSGAAFLIDEDGIVVRVDDLTALIEVEAEFTELIAVLFERKGARAGK